MILSMAINRLAMLYPLEKERLRLSLRDERDFSNLSAEELSRIVGRFPASFRRLQFPLVREMAYHDLHWLEQIQVVALHYAHAQYPPLLRKIYDPPFLLLCRGRLPVRQPCIAIVGTRHPSGMAITAARDFAAECALADITVISGLARGIDRAAHEGALPKPNLVVLGSGIDVIYPSDHRFLARDILESGGAIFSEYPPGTPPLRHHFIARNRIISGMAQSVVVVQAPERSGALITASYALEQGRSVYVHIEGMHSAGTQKLVEDGAVMLRCLAELVSDSQDMPQWTRITEGVSL